MENIYSTIKPFYILSKTLGLFPMSFEGPSSKGFLRVKWFDVVGSGLAVLASVSIMCANVVYDASGASPSAFLSKVWSIALFCGTFLVSVQSLIQFNQTHSIVGFLLAIDNFDQKARSLNLLVDYERHRKFLLKISWTVASVLMMMLFLTLFHYFDNIQVKFVLVLTSTYQLLYNFFYVTQFACAALALRERFKLLNEYLAGFVRIPFISGNTTTSHIICVRNKNFRLELFSDLYGDLCDCIEVINSTFTTQITYVLVNLLAIDIFGGYGILREFLTNRKVVMFFMVANGSWIVIHYGIKAFMCHAGTSTTNEAEKSIPLIIRMISQSPNQESRTDLSSLLIQMRCRNKKLKNGLFTINWNLILAMTSTIVTYLIITCQFDVPANLRQ